MKVMARFRVEGEILEVPVSKSQLKAMKRNASEFYSGGVFDLDACGLGLPDFVEAIPSQGGSPTSK